MASDIILGTYSPEEVTILITVADQTHIVSGLATGTFVNVTRTTPASSLVVGSDLSAFRVKRRNKASDIAITLHQASISNRVFQQMQIADEEDATDTYVFSIVIKDNSGQSLYFARQAFIGTQADSGFSDSETGENREWMIHAVNLQTLVGGNTKMDESAVSVVEALGGSIEDRWKL